MLSNVFYKAKSIKLYLIYKNQTTHIKIYDRCYKHLYFKKFVMIFVKYIRCMKKIKNEFFNDKIDINFINLKNS